MSSQTRETRTRPAPHSRTRKTHRDRGTPSWSMSGRDTPGRTLVAIILGWSKEYRPNRHDDATTDQDGHAVQAGTMEAVAGQGRRPWQARSGHGGGTGSWPSVRCSRPRGHSTRWWRDLGSINGAPPTRSTRPPDRATGCWPGLAASGPTRSPSSGPPSRCGPGWCSWGRDAAGCTATTGCKTWSAATCTAPTGSCRSSSNHCRSGTA